MVFKVSDTTRTKKKLFKVADTGVQHLPAFVLLHVHRVVPNACPLIGEEAIHEPLLSAHADLLLYQYFNAIL